MKRGTPLPVNSLHALSYNTNEDENDLMNVGLSEGLATPSTSMDMDDRDGQLHQQEEQTTTSFLPMLSSHSSSHHDAPLTTSMDDLTQHDIADHDDRGDSSVLDDYHSQQQQAQHDLLDQDFLTTTNDINTTNTNPPIASADNAILIVKHIASYLSLSDVESMASLGSLVALQRHSSSSVAALSSSSSLHERHHMSNSNDHNDHVYWSHDTKEPSAIGRTTTTTITEQEYQNHAENYDNTTNTTNTLRHTLHATRHSLNNNSSSSSHNNTMNQYQSWSSLITTPDTPGIMALTPDFLDDEELPELMGIDENDNHDIDHNDDNDDCHDDEYNKQVRESSSSSSINEEEDDDKNDDDDEEDNYLRQRLEQKQKKWIQQKLTNAVFSHPKSLRSFCVEAHQAAMEIQRTRRTQQLQQLQQEQLQQQSLESQSPETLREPHNEEYNNLQQNHHEQRYHTTTTSSVQRSTTRKNQSGHHHLSIKKKKKKTKRHHHQQQQRHLKFVRHLIRSVLHNVPLSIIVDLMENVLEVGLDTASAIFTLECRTLNSIVSGLCFVISNVWDKVLSFNPLKLMDTLISIQFNAVGKTSEVIVTGMQSVATGVGSVSTAALHRLSRTSGADHHHHHDHHDSSIILDSEIGIVLGDTIPSGSSKNGGGGLRRNNTSHHRMLQITEAAANVKLIRKLSSINSAAKVISYREMDEGAAITRHAKKRVQRMMHYDVSLKPFEATVILPQQKERQSRRNGKTTNNGSSSSSNNGRVGSSGVGDSNGSHNRSFENFDSFASPNQQQGEQQGLDQTLAQFQQKNEQGLVSPPSSASSSPLGSPFMCTPKSFPPTPSSRQMVMARGTRFVEDVVFLARDQLRVQGALESNNERTRAMAQALREGRRLAVFNAADTGTGIALTCGQHVATKVGNVLYCSTRSMIPVLRNCFVYFEMSVMTPQQPLSNTNPAAAAATMMMPASLATLSIGLSTLEMPLNTLVGAWKGSVGLCTTGQILSAGQWSSPLDPSLSSYGDGATVGCLACVNDNTAFETWDGVMVTASITFNVNGTVISPPSSSSAAGGMEWGGTGGFPPQLQEQQQQQQKQQIPSARGPVSTLPLLVPMEEEIFPTLTLHSPTTQVMCRFSAEDILAESRSSIGAPHGVPIYAIDGSVLFDIDG